MKRSISIPLVLFVTALTLCLGYACATAYFTFRDFGFTADIDWFWLARSYLPLRTVRPDDFWTATAVIGGFGSIGFAASCFAIWQR